MVGKNSTYSDTIKIWYVGRYWFPTLKIFYRSPFSKWPSQNRKNSTLSDIIKIWYVGRQWCPELIPDWKMSTGQHFQNGRHNTAQIQHCPISTTFHMLVDYDITNWFLTSKNFYQSSFSKWPPQCRANSTLFDFNEISYLSRLWCPELIPDIAKFLPVSIFKLATTILQKIKLRICHNAKCSFKPVVSGRFGRLHNC